MNNKFLVGGLIGGVACFLLGYLIYVLALGDTMAANAMPGVNKTMEEFNWPFIVLGNLASGFLLSYVMTKSNTSGFGPGATMGAIIGLLVAMGFDFIMYGTSNIMTSMQA
ncbi:MAG: hypothetical protein ABIQ02_12475, partial [Saprospiraceae bacterium]